MGMAGTTTLSERDLMKQYATMTITVKRPASHRLLQWTGLQLMKAGCLLAGFGGVVIEEEESE